MKKILSLILIISIFQTGCEEDGPITNPDPSPVIERVKPLSHQVYSFGDTAFFKLNFSDNGALTQSKLRIYLATNEELLNLTFVPNASTFVIDTFILMNDSAYSYVNFNISASDNSGNVTSQSSHIHLRN